MLLFTQVSITPFAMYRFIKINKIIFGNKRSFLLMIGKERKKKRKKESLFIIFSQRTLL
jgi:hypothetical protein